MELNDLYVIATGINEKVENGELNKDKLNDIEIVVSVTPTILYGIDKEFYRLSNDDNTDGFEPSEEVSATIDDVRFLIKSKTTVD